nr:rhodanese-like domain-containing protein [Paenibacillus sediminis]
MTIFGVVVILPLFMWFYQRVVPIKEAKWINTQQFESLIQSKAEIQIVDVRDTLDYDKKHISGSINIPLGRLSFVWHKSIRKDKRIVITSSRRADQIRAARKLKRAGFTDMYILCTDVTHLCEQTRSKLCAQSL